MGSRTVAVAVLVADWAVATDPGADGSSAAVRARPRMVSKVTTDDGLRSERMVATP
jgi:hypothetical protein